MAKTKIIIAKEELEELYINQNLSTVEIGKIYNCSEDIIQYKLKCAGIKKERDLSVNCIHCNSTNIHKQGINKSGFKKFQCNDCKKHFTSNTLKYNQDIKEYHDKIKDLYCNHFLSTPTIGKLLGVSHIVIQRICKKNGWSRSISDSQILTFHGSFEEHRKYLESLPLYKQYRRRISSLTEKEPIHTLTDSEKRGSYKIPGSYHLDHKYSVMEGFVNNINPKIISHISNLEFLPYQDNISKGSKCSITLNELLEKIKETNPELLKKLSWV